MQKCRISAHEQKLPHTLSHWQLTACMMMLMSQTYCEQFRLNLDISTCEWCSLAVFYGLHAPHTIYGKTSSTHGNTHCC